MRMSCLLEIVLGCAGYFRDPFQNQGKTADCGTISPPPLCICDDEKETAEPSVMFVLGTDLQCSQHRVPFPTGSFMRFFASRFFNPVVG
jgi:hypothetical protein